MDEEDYQAEILSLRQVIREQDLRLSECARLLDIYKQRMGNIAAQVKRAIDLNITGDHIHVATRLNTIQIMSESRVSLPREELDE